MIYFDNNATTCVSESVFNCMVPYLTEKYGNPSSMYGFGATLKTIINDSRKSIANLINADENQIIFTSGGSESNCTAISSGLQSNDNRRKIISSCVEHASIMEQLKKLQYSGYEVLYAPVDSYGRIDYSFIRKNADDNTALIILMLANNETGNIYDVSMASEIAHKCGALFHCDAVQAAGKIPIDVKSINADTLSISGHKFHAPKGIGALYIKDSTGFSSLICGHQEVNRRGGTENVASIVAIGVAAKDAVNNMNQNQVVLHQLHDYLVSRLKESFSNIMIFGDSENCLPNTVNFALKNIRGEEMLIMLSAKGVCVSTGSACNSSSLDPSYVLKAMNVPENYIWSIRVSFSSNNTIDEIDYFIEQLKKIYQKKQ